MTSTKKRIAAALTATILSAAVAIPTMATETPTIRVISYKGSTLEMGERSDLIIGSSGANYTVTSSNPDTVAVEQVLTDNMEIRQEMIRLINQTRKANGVSELPVNEALMN
ncbi:MAG: CAP domain-containing protein, partial [Oscillospiraceae bacterium]|nr:CAP domain-containing protein [Oscillospiraceae bacterium]